MTDKEKVQLKYRIAITLIPGVGPVTAKMLISYCSGVENVFKEKKSTLQKISGVGEKIAAEVASFKNFDEAEAEVEFIDRYKISPLFYSDRAYPQRLRNCSDAPVMLYYKGNGNLNADRLLAIVGTRNATDYGKQQTEKIVDGLLPFDVSIVSGLAYGIDIAAHKAALKNNLPTVAVLAHGLDMVYPGSHKKIAEKIIRGGGLLTEYKSKTKPDRENFPARNRIVAGISDATLIIEAADTGGALITGEMAVNYNRDVFALPGRTDDHYSRGCNRIIKTNKAALVENADDLVYQMSWQSSATVKQAVQRELFIELQGDEKLVFDFLQDKRTAGIDTLVVETLLPVSKISAALLNLEFKGLVKSLPGKMYQAL